MKQILAVRLKRIWSLRDFVVVPLAILGIYLALPARPAELQAIRLSSVDLLSSLKSGGVMAADSPLEVYWRDPLRPDSHRGVKVAALTLSYVYLLNKGSQSLEWADAFEHPIQFRIKEPEVILEADVVRWEDRPDGLGFQVVLGGGGQTCSFSTPLVRPVDKIGLVILHTGPPESLQIAGRQKGFAPIEWTDGASVESKSLALEGIKGASVPVFLGIWIGSAGLLFASGRSGFIALASGLALGFIAVLAGALIAGWIIIWSPGAVLWTQWKWIGLYVLCAITMQVVLNWFDVFSTRTAPMRLIEAFVQIRRQAAGSQDS